MNKMAKDKKVFVQCPDCKATVRDINLELHRVEVHGILPIESLRQFYSTEDEKDKWDKGDVENAEGKDGGVESDGGRAEFGLGHFYHYQGHVLLKCGERREAEEYFLKATACNKKDLCSLLMLARLAPTCERAEMYLKKALEINPSHYSALFELVDHKLKRDKFDEARELLQKIVNAYPEDFDSRMALINLLMRRARFSDAHDELKALLPITAMLKENGEIDEDELNGVKALLKRCEKIIEDQKREAERETEVDDKYLIPICPDCQMTLRKGETVKDETGGGCSEYICDNCGKRFADIEIPLTQITDGKSGENGST